jgi:uncharacterized repeat protein (TIGR04138 family)
MFCEQCKEREATIHFTTITGDQLTKRDLCIVCGQPFLDPAQAAAMSQNNCWEDVLDRIVASDSRYKKAAYRFLQSAMTASICKQFGKSCGRGSPHVSAARLLEAMREFAVAELGKQAKAKLNSWGVFKCEDFGEMVFNLVKAGVMVQQEQDSKADFQGGYDFDTAFPS